MPVKKKQIKKTRLAAGYYRFHYLFTTIFNYLQVKISTLSRALVIIIIIIIIIIIVVIPS